MPKRTVAKLTTKEKDKYFVSLYVKKGTDESEIPYCERRAGLKAGSGKKILARKSVKKEISFRLGPVQAEQTRQKTLGEAVVLAKKVYQEQLASQLEIIKCHKIEMPVLLGRLMQGVIGIDMNTWPKELLEYIKTAMVVEGAIQSGNTKRLIPAENPQENPAAGIYTALFNRIGSQSLPVAPSLETPASEQEGVSDLFPQPPKPALSAAKGIPLPGESIDELPPEKSSNPNVITVQVE